MHEVACEGHVKRIIWAEDSSGRRHGQEYFDDLSVADRAKIVALFTRMADYGEIRNEQKFRNEGSGVYCFKSGLHRLPCFINGTDIVITHGFHKRGDKMPAVERDRSLRIGDVYKRRGGQRDG